MEMGTQSSKSKRLGLVRGVNASDPRGRRYRQILRSILNALSDEPTTWQLMVAESAASLRLQIETLRTRQVEGAEVSSDKLVKLAGSLRRHLRDLAIGDDAS